MVARISVFTFKGEFVSCHPSFFQNRSQIQETRKKECLTGWQSRLGFYHLGGLQGLENARLGRCRRRRGPLEVGHG